MRHSARTTLPYKTRGPGLGLGVVEVSGQRAEGRGQGCAQLQDSVVGGLLVLALVLMLTGVCAVMEGWAVGPVVDRVQHSP